MDTFVRSRPYLLGAADQADAGTSIGLEALLLAVIGLWICGARSSAAAALERIRPSIDLIRGLGARHAELLLLSQGIARSLGLRIPALESYGESAAADLRTGGPAPPAALGRALLLARLGYLRPPPQPRLEESLLGRSAESLLGAKAHELRAACRNLSSATHFGLRRPVGDPVFIAEIRRVLTPLCVQVLRGYNLELGATLLRTLVHLRTPRTRFLRLATAFVRDQQQADGRFGYYEIEVAAGRGKISFDPDLDLYLPTTVSALSTLAEALSPGFRAYALPSRWPLGASRKRGQAPPMRG